VRTSCPAQDRTGEQWARAILANAAIPPAQHARRVQVPSGFSLFPGDIIRPPRAWLERTANVVRVTELRGHADHRKSLHCPPCR